MNVLILGGGQKTTNTFAVRKKAESQPKYVFEDEFGKKKLFGEVSRCAWGGIRVLEGVYGSPKEILPGEAIHGEQEREK